MDKPAVVPHVYPHAVLLRPEDHPVEGINRGQVSALRLDRDPEVGYELALNEDAIDNPVEDAEAALLGESDYIEKRILMINVRLPDPIDFFAAVERLLAPFHDTYNFFLYMRTVDTSTYRRY